MRSLVLLIILSLFIIGAAPARALGSVAFNSDISSLEMRFFFRTYANESDNERLDRLDQVVFGHSSQGSEQERVSRLLLAVPNVQSTVGQQATSTPTTADPLKAERPVLAAVPPSVLPANSPSTSTFAQPPQTQSTREPYPAVSALEEQILGKSEPNLPLPQRLANMETKAFGKPSTSTDLGARVDLLKQYIAQKNGGREDYLTSSNAVGWAPGNESLEGQVASMEKEVYGVTYARDRLSSRLDRLEKTLLPKQPAQTFTPLVTRVEQLEAALNPTGAHQQMTTLAQNSQPRDTFKKKHSIFHKLGAIAADVGEVAARSALSGGYGGYGYGGYGGSMGSPFGYW